MSLTGAQFLDIMSGETAKTVTGATDTYEDPYCLGWFGDFDDGVRSAHTGVPPHKHAQARNGDAYRLAPNYP
jgi:hypothetical protein